MKINTIGRGSKLIVSSTKQEKIFVRNKKNQGFGEHNADGCLFICPISILNDNDILDSTSTPQTKSN